MNLNSKIIVDIDLEYAYYFVEAHQGIYAHLLETKK